MTKTEKRPEVRIKPHTYQPSKAEMREDVSINASPDDLAEAVLKSVKIVRDNQPGHRKPDRLASKGCIPRI